jgi:hypothetical protein
MLTIGAYRFSSEHELLLVSRDDCEIVRLQTVEARDPLDVVHSQAVPAGTPRDRVSQGKFCAYVDR